MTEAISLPDARARPSGLVFTACEWPSPIATRERAYEHSRAERGTGKRLDSDCCLVFEVRNGQMVSGRQHFFDLHNWDAFWA
jgi:hypothetical protein